MKTDNSAASYILTQPKLSAKQARWQEFLAEFDMEIEYRSGRTNQVADALSRRADLASLAQIAQQSASRVSSNIQEQIKEHLDQDMLAKNLKQLIEEGKTRRFWIEGDLIYTKGHRLYVPKSGNLRRALMRECHDTLWAGHPGWHRMMSLLKQGYYWPDMKEDVMNYTRTCLTCQQDKIERQRPAGLLEPLPVPSRPWESVSMDFISSLPKVGEHSSVFVVVDRFSKYATFIPTTKSSNATETAQLFFKHVVKFWGVPQNIVSDRDARFTGKFWTELFNILGSELNMSSSYHPQSDGQTERFNGMLEEYLRHFVSANQKNWVDLLDIAQFCFNIHQSSSSNKSPMEIIMGQQPLLPHTVATPYTGRCPKAYQFAKDWKQNSEVAKAFLEKASKRMKKWADEKRRPREFNVGDQVLIKLLPEQVRSLRNKDKRLIQKYMGPVPIIARIGKVAYKVELPPGVKIHPVLHVGVLKPYFPDMGDPSRNISKRPHIKISFNVSQAVEDILAQRQVKDPNTGEEITEYLVKWKDKGEEDNSWEVADDLTPISDIKSTPTKKPQSRGSTSTH